MNANSSNIFKPGRVLAVLGALLALACWRVLFGGETFFYRDFGVMSLPGAQYHRSTLLEGSFPLWNPYSNCGAPFLAQWGTMVLYPPSLIYVLLPFPWSLNAFCLLHLWLGGAGAYFLIRRWTQSDPAAAVGATAFLFSGVLFSTLTWPNYTVAAGLFPWVVLTVDRAWDASGGRARAIALASLAAAAQLLAGVPELSLFTWMLLSALWLLRLAQKADRLAVLATHAAIVAATAGLAAAQFLPFWELLQISQRAPGFAAEKWALPPWGWANFILPQFYTFRTPEGTTYQYGQEFLSSTYLGAPIIALACAGVFFGRDPRRWVLAGTAVLAAVLALGSAGHVLPALQAVFPLISVGRYPVKFLYLLLFAVAPLAALGWQALASLDPKRRARFLIAATGGFSLLLGALYWFNLLHPFPYDRLAELKSSALQRWVFAIAFLAAASRAALHPSWLVILLVLTVADTLNHLKKQNPTLTANLFGPVDWPSTHKRAKPELGLGRIFISPEAETRLLHSSAASPEQDIVGKRLANWSHLNLLDRVPKVNGSSTLQLGAQARVQTALYGGTNVNREDWLDFLGVTLKTSSNSIVEWSPRDSARAFVAAGLRAVGEPQLSVADATNLAEQVWIENPQRQVLAEPARATVSNVRVSAHRVSFTVQSDRETYAVVAQSWHPAWQAEVNGTPEPILKANIAFQAVRVPAGQSQVTLVYRDRAFRLGSALSLATAAILGFAALRITKSAR